MKKKVLFILHLPPPIHGASMIGRYIKDSKLIGESFDCSFINLSTSQRLNDIGKSGHKKLINIIKVFRKVLFTVIKKRFDLCYITINAKGSGFYKEIIIVFLLKILRYKLVYHYHNKGVIDFQDKWFFDKLYRFQFKNSKAILLSQLLYPDVSKYLSKENVYYCANGVPLLNDTTLDSLSESRRKKVVPEILFLSNMMEEKGVFTLIEACKILLKNGINFRTNFIGSPSDITASQLNSYITTNNLESNIFYLGKKYDNEKATYFKSADIFVFPTYYHNETFGLVNLEAMQYGLPIISTDEGAISEAVKDGINGFLIPKKDPEILAEKINYLIRNPQVGVEMGKNGREIFEDQYTLEKFENNFTKILNQIIIDYYNGIK